MYIPVIVAVWTGQQVKGIERLAGGVGRLLKGLESSVRQAPMADSFPMFTRCSLAQWRGYPEDIRKTMENDISSGWFLMSLLAMQDKAQASKSRVFLGSTPLWWLEDSGLRVSQSVLMKIIYD